MPMEPWSKEPGQRERERGEEMAVEKER